nr:phosphoinositide phospholipase C 4-like [Ipomoea batatas]
MPFSVVFIEKQRTPVKKTTRHDGDPGENNHDSDDYEKAREPPPHKLWQIPATSFVPCFSPPETSKMRRPGNRRPRRCGDAATWDSEMRSGALALTRMITDLGLEVAVDDGVGRLHVLRQGSDGLGWKLWLESSEAKGGG